MLVDTVSKDGNLLLNVGPNGRGELDERAIATLREPPGTLTLQLPVARPDVAVPVIELFLTA